MIRDLLKDHETVIVQLRENTDECDEKFGDKGTADFLTDLIREHETVAWILKRYLN